MICFQLERLSVRKDKVLRKAQGPPTASITDTAWRSAASLAEVQRGVYAIPPSQ
jgi:hypothetical protein